MNYRCISVNHQIENDFTNNLIYPQAILIEDINNDNKNEFIVGTANGEILIYKNNLEKPWLKNSKLIGCITCLAFDSFTDSKQKYLIVHDALGCVYFFSINQVWLRKRYASDISAAKSYPGDWKLDLCNIYQTKLLINPKYILIDDLYNNGSKKMIIGYTDRKIRCFSWLNTSQSSSNNNNTANSTNNLTKTNANSNSKGSLASQVVTNYGFQEMGKIILDQTWELPDLIYSIEIFKESNDKKSLLCSIAGGKVMILNTTSDSMIESSSSSFSSLSQITQNQQNILLSNVEELYIFSNENENNDQNANMLAQPSFLITNVNFNKMNNYAFLVKSNGEVSFFQMNNNMSESGMLGVKNLIWQKNLNIFVMKYYKIDINKDENDELLLITHDGQVFIINCCEEVVCIDLGEPIKLFHMGHYSVNEMHAPTSTINANAIITNLTENVATSEVDLHQCNPAFELALDSPSIGQQPPNFKSDLADGNNTSAPSSNTFCFIFVSTITNKINLVQTDAIMSYSKLKPLSQLSFRCENVFSHSQKFSSKVNELLSTIESPNDNDLFDIYKKKCEILSKILYQ